MPRVYVSEAVAPSLYFIYPAICRVCVRYVFENEPKDKQNHVFFSTDMNFVSIAMNIYLVMTVGIIH